MFVSVDSKALSLALAKVARCIGSRSFLPILSAVKLTAGTDTLTLEGTDMDSWLSVTIPADTGAGAEWPARVAVVGPVKQLAGIVKTLAGTVTLELLADGAGLAVSSDGSRSIVPTFPLEDYPVMPAPDVDSSDIEPVQVARLTLSDILETFEGVKHAYGRDESRPILCGVLFRFDTAGRLELTATDSYRLAVETVSTGAECLAGATVEVCVPGRLLETLARVAKPAKGTEPPMVDVSLSGAYTASQDSRREGGSFSGRHIRFRFGTDMLVCRIIDGQYPDAGRLRPDHFEGTYRPAVASTVAALERIAKGATRTGKHGGTAPVRVKLTESVYDPATVTRSDATTVVLELRGAESFVSSETVPGTFHGADMEIGFNPSFLSDALESLRSESVDVQVINPLRPALLTNGKPDCWRLIMPVRLSDAA